MKKSLILLIFLWICIASPFEVRAQTERIEAKIITLKNHEVTVEILEGSEKGKEYPIALFDDKQAGIQGLHAGDRVLISFVGVQGGGQQPVIVDHVRRTPLIMLFLLFLAVVVYIGRKKGILSFFAMVFSFLIIVQFIIPQIILGNDPLLISLIGAIFIIPSIFYISHGFHTKTTIAVVGTFLSLIVTGILSVIFVQMASLTGYASEEASFIQAMGMEQVNIQSLLLAGIIIGAMGVLDDITISQTSIVEKLMKANPKYTRAHLFNEAMDVGRDHIASLVNTLILVYSGAALPLFILFSGSNFAYSQVINMEVVATEIVRTLVSSIGIIAAVPITTIIAVWFLKPEK